MASTTAIPTTTEEPIKINLNFNDTETMVFFIVAIVIWTLAIPEIGIYILHSNQFPIAGRQVGLVIANLVFLLIFMTAMLSERVALEKCTNNIGVAVFSYGMVATGMFARGWKVYFKCISSNQRHLTCKNLDAADEWFTRNKYLASNALMWSMYAGGVVVMGITAAVFQGVFPGCGETPSIALLSFVVFLSFILLIVCIVFFEFKLKGNKINGLGILTEFKYLCVLLFIVGVLLIPSHYVQTHVDNVIGEQISLEHLLIVFLTLGFLVVTIWFPLSKLDSRKKQNSTGMVEEEDTAVSLEMTLSDKLGRDQFRAFLATEFSVENMLILDAIEDFEQAIRARQKQKQRPKKSFMGSWNPGQTLDSNPLQSNATSPSNRTESADINATSPSNRTESADITEQRISSLGLPNDASTSPPSARGSSPRGSQIAQIDEGETTLDKARDIFMRYIEPGATHQVNLSSVHVTNTRKLLYKESGQDPIIDNWFKVFEDAKTEIFLLCERDSFPRFQNSKLCDTFLQARGKKAHRTEMKSLLVHICMLHVLACAGIFGVCLGCG